MVEKSIISELWERSVMSGDDQRNMLLVIQRLCKRFGFNDSMSVLMAHLMLQQRPMSIEDLMSATHLSRTSVSTTLGTLESKNLVIKEKKGRVGYYISNFDFTKMIADQPTRVLEEEIKPLISIVEKGQKAAQDEEQEQRYGMLLTQLKGSAATLERIIKCMQATR
ncbi:MAG: BlaI/MecI/CopY family transcriptional regulator [Nitrososphaerota archaeon]|nr:BlaI/MecI/CopY family transcriptional regulator [Nitrososphaerota archaeon]